MNTPTLVLVVAVVLFSLGMVVYLVRCNLTTTEKLSQEARVGMDSQAMSFFQTMRETDERHQVLVEKLVFGVSTVMNEPSPTPSEPNETETEPEPDWSAMPESALEAVEEEYRLGSAMPPTSSTPHTDSELRL